MSTLPVVGSSLQAPCTFESHSHSYCSIYQKPRTPLQDVCFARALRGMSLWYAHMGTFVFLFNSPLAEPKHEMRGWCTFERAMSRLCK